MERYKVVLTGFTRGEEFFRAGLMRLGMRVAQVERVIASVPCVLKQGLSLDEARKYEAAFAKAGGQVEVDTEGAAAQAGQAALGTPAPEHAPAQAPDPEAPLLAAVAVAAPEVVEPEPARSLPLPAGIDPHDLIDLTKPPPAGANVEGAAAVATAGAAATAPGLPLEAPKGAVFKAPNPWIARGILGGIALVLASVTANCVGKYTVLDRQHDFSTGIEETFQQDLHRVGRAKGNATIDDVHAAIDAAARRAKVSVEVYDVQEWYVESVQTGAIDGSGNSICSVDHSIAEKLPMGRRMGWIQAARSCTAPPWVIGFTADVTARWGWNDDTVFVEHYAFIPVYTKE